MIWKLIKEEWRKDSTLYRGRSIAAFPVTVFAFAFLWNYFVVNYSTIMMETVGISLQVLAAFIGFAVGSMGFTSRDAFRNTLGRTDYLVHSAHTLPVSKKKLYGLYILRNPFYYLALVFLPVTLGFLIPTEFAVISSFYNSVAIYFIAFFVSTGLTMSSISLPSQNFLNYSRLGFLKAIADKSILDVFRSSGGVTKIVFSLGILTGFYWTLVLYFPITEIFLNNALLSYSVMIGMVNLSIYNWLNRFDSLESYDHLPMDIFSVVNGKEQAYFVLAIPSSVILVLLSRYFYPGHLWLALITAVSTTVYNLAIAVLVTGLKPNERLFQADVFMKYLFGIGVMIVPLLYLSITYTEFVLGKYLGICMLGLLAGLYMYFYRDRASRKKGR